MIQIALNQYNQDIDDFEKAKADREACVGRVESRANNITNWHDSFDGLRLLAELIQSDVLLAYANNQQTTFDSRPQNQPLTVTVNCKDFPDPRPVIVPHILVEEGYVDN